MFLCWCRSLLWTTEMCSWWISTRHKLQIMQWTAATELVLPMVLVTQLCLHVSLRLLGAHFLKQLVFIVAVCIWQPLLCLCLLAAILINFQCCSDLTCCYVITCSCQYCFFCESWFVSDFEFVYFSKSVVHNVAVNFSGSTTVSSKSVKHAA